jgi:Flp pilus assembly protein TadG
MRDKMTNQNLTSPPIPPPTWRRFRRPNDRSARGTSLVELALALPTLLLIMLGTIDMGRMFFDYIQLRSAVVDGAAYAARNPGDVTGIKNETTGAGVPPQTVVPDPSFSGNCSTRGGNGKVTVAATSAFTPATFQFFAMFDLGPVTLRASSTMRCMT